MIKEKIKNILAGARLAFHSCFLISYLLFFVFAVNLGRARNGWLDLFLLIVTFIFAHSSGFLFNNYHDRFIDPPHKNSISSKKLSAKTAMACSVLFAIFSLIFFLMLNPQKIVLVAFVIYLFSWFAYSGLKLRLKESLWGPFLASEILWTGPSLIILLLYRVYEPWILIILAGLFFIYSAHEINHTLWDFDIDKKGCCKTFTVRLGSSVAKRYEFIFFLIGTILIIIGVENSYLYARHIFLLFIMSIFIRYVLWRNNLFSFPYKFISFITGVWAIAILNLSILWKILMIILICRILSYGPRDIIKVEKIVIEDVNKAMGQIGIYLKESHSKTYWILKNLRGKLNRKK